MRNQQAIKTSTTDKVKFEVGYLQNCDGNEEGRLTVVRRIFNTGKTADDSWPSFWNARKGVVWTDRQPFYVVVRTPTII
jgi:hypothetical protein